MPHGDVRDGTGIFWKNPRRAKITKNGQKRYENRVFGLFRKIVSFVLSGNGVKWNVWAWLKMFWANQIIL